MQKMTYSAPEAERAWLDLVGSEEEACFAYIRGRRRRRDRGAAPPTTAATECEASVVGRSGANAAADGSPRRGARS